MFSIEIRLTNGWMEQCVSSMQTLFSFRLWLSSCLCTDPHLSRLRGAVFRHGKLSENTSASIRPFQDTMGELGERQDPSGGVMYNQPEAKLTSASSLADPNLAV